MARAMKDSGIEWIGEIPEGWKVSPVKNYIKWKSEKGYPDAQVLSLYRDFGIVPKDSRDDNHNVTSLDTSGYKYVEVGDLVINKMKAWQGSIAVSNYSGIVSPAYHVCQIVGDGIYKQYLHYLLRNPAYLPEYMRLSTGMRVGQWDLGFDDFKNIPIVLPDMLEQKRIVSFLDAECARIDAVIEQTRASIEEYKKLKQSVITQAVTKGIRPGRKMKDSGVEWIGAIPEEWVQATINKFCSLKTGGTPSTANSEWFDGDLNWFTPGDFSEQYTLSVSARKLSFKAKADGAAVIIPKDTVMIVGIGGTAGKIGFTTCECSCNQQVTAIITNQKIKSRFLMYWMIANTKRLKDTALYTTLPIINNQTIGEYPILVPNDIDEQNEIICFLDEESKEIENLIKKKHKLIEALESYKKSLIFEYVTGKKEVV